MLRRLLRLPHSGVPTRQAEFWYLNNPLPAPDSRLSMTSRRAIRTDLFAFDHHRKKIDLLADIESHGHLE